MKLPTSREPEQAGVRISIEEAFDEAGLILGAVVALFASGLLHGDIPTLRPPSTNLGDRQALLRQINFQAGENLPAKDARLHLIGVDFECIVQKNLRGGYRATATVAPPGASLLDHPACLVTTIYKPPTI